MAVSAIQRAEKELEKAQEKMDQARARLQAAKARESEAERKKMTRRKVILGGALVERAERDPRFAEVVRTLVGDLSRDQDKKAFEGWVPPSPGDASSPGDTGSPSEGQGRGEGAGSPAL